MPGISYTEEKEAIREVSTILGSVATLHVRDVPLCCFRNSKVEEGRHDQLQGQSIRAGNHLVGRAMVCSVSDFVPAVGGNHG
jgi:hypothetical protein